MINTKKQAIYTIFIAIGAVLLIYDLAFASEEVYLKIIGLVLLMFGLYSSTRQWSSDNDKNTEDENELVKEEEDLETNEHPKENKEN
jgi:uncharacterized membrane protein YfcA